MDLIIIFRKFLSILGFILCTFRYSVDALLLFYDSRNFCDGKTKPFCGFDEAIVCETTEKQKIKQFKTSLLETKPPKNGK